MCTEVNSAMGLQATAATKRKHELTFDGKDANTTYTTNCPPPIKAGRWSMNNNNYIESLEEQAKITLKSKPATNGTSSIEDIKATANVINNNNSNTNNNNINNINNNNNDGKRCVTASCNRLNGATTQSTCITNGKQETTKASVTTQNGTPSTTVVNSLVTSLIPQSAALAPTSPLPPTSTTPVPEDSIAKLEVVAAVPCEPWVNSTEPVDCISKLQAVAVPSDPWGSISTRSTLATTLLSADELDDDDDDFEDDYEEEESIIPTYCPLRYHPFPTASTPNSPQQASRLGSYSPTPSYGSRPNYYSEPFPQQNCSRTGGPQHTRNMPNGFSQWHNNNANSQQFYGTSEVTYPSQQQQQTIRCAENGKSYLDLGCSSSTPVASINTATPTVPSVPPFVSLHAGSPNLDARHPLKRCCDARGTWCNTNKNCYRDIRLKIRNLSMFKLSRFRQVSEQSLYRSVLICNTLKRIDREIEAEAKEMHQVAVAHAAQHHQQQLYHQQHLPLHLQHHPHLNQPHSQQQLQQQQQPQLQQLQQQQHHEYVPVMNCARLANLEYQSHNAQQQQQSVHGSVHYHHQQQQQQQQQQQHYHNQPERLDTPPPPQPHHNSYLHNTSLIQKPPTSSYSPSHTTTCHNVNAQSTATGTATATTSMPLHPYDNYPFRDSQSGRATPFPNSQPVIPSAALNSTSVPQTQQQQQQQQQQPTQVQPASTTETIITQSAITPSVSSSSASPTTTTANATTAATEPAGVSVTPQCSTSNAACDSDSGYADDDSTRTINWSSVLSLSSQSALDPLNSNDLFSILPPATSVTSPATAVPVPVPVSLPNATSTTTLTNVENALTAAAIAISGTFTTVQSASTCSSSSATTNAANSAQTDDSTNSATSSNSSTTATFTTLTTIPATTYSLTSSYVSSITTSNASNSSNSTWEYGFLDMEFGLGSEFTELMPSCKLSSDDLFKNALTPVSTSRYSSVHDNELEQPAHIMVGS